MTAKPYTPRAYQPAGIAHIVDHERCALWASMGAGKSLMTLTALEAIALVDDSNPTLVIAPLRVARDVWPYETLKWQHLQHLEVAPIVGDARQRAAALSHRNAQIFTINYENLEWLDTALEGKPWPFATVIADESTRLKGFRLRQGGRRARAIARHAHKDIKRWVNLTGTPSPNGLQDLWGQTWFLDQGQRLGRTHAAFVNRWFRTKYDGFGLEPLPFAEPQIHGALRDLCLTIDFKDYYDIREPIFNTILVDLPGPARHLYQQMERKMFAEIAGHPVEAFNAATRTNKCLQLANGAAYVGENTDRWEETHTVKLEALEEIVEEAGGTPVLVAYEFVSDKERILRAFPRARLLKTKQDEDDWNAGKIPMLVAHPKSAGHGLNLQDGGNILAFFGHNWNLEERLQILERIGPVRQMQSGHDRAVLVYDIVARDTIEEDVLLRHESKREVQDLLLNAMKRRG